MFVSRLLQRIMNRQSTHLKSAFNEGVYPPAILFVDGHFSSGKTTFIRTLSEIEVVSAEAEKEIMTPEGIETRAINLDFGRISVTDNFPLYFFGLPAALPRWYLYGNEDIWFPNMICLGMLFLINSDCGDDARLEDRLRESKFLLNAISENDYPYVIINNPKEITANPESKNYEAPTNIDAWDTESLRAYLRLPKHIPFIECNVKNRQSAKQALLLFLEYIDAKLSDDVTE